MALNSIQTIICTSEHSVLTVVRKSALRPLLNVLGSVKKKDLRTSKACQIKRAKTENSTITLLKAMPLFIRDERALNLRLQTIWLCNSIVTLTVTTGKGKKRTNAQWCFVWKRCYLRLITLRKTLTVTYSWLVQIHINPGASKTKCVIVMDNGISEFKDCLIGMVIACYFYRHTVLI
jgi:hypothetical protein